ALEIDPDLAATHHALGLLLVRLSRLEEAVEALGRAARADPDNVRFIYVHAVALESAGRLPEALQALGEAHLRHPRDREILAALVVYWRMSGDEGRAMEYARKLEALDP
ncbi:MAG: tetratricopeptide repeat protein, partial [Planctomycetota bacterium]